MSPPARARAEGLVAACEGFQVALIPDVNYEIAKLKDRMAGCALARLP